MKTILIQPGMHAIKTDLFIITNPFRANDTSKTAAVSPAMLSLYPSHDWLRQAI
jgi:hypothetical protein